MNPEQGGPRRLGRILTIFLIAVGVNVLLFGLVAWNAREVAIRADMTVPTGVTLVTLPPPEPEEPQETPRPKPPTPEPELDFTPDLRPPAFGELDAGISFAMDLDLGAFDVDSGLGSVVFQAHELDKVPQVLMRIPPEYPYRARHRGIEGVVKVQLLINVDGSVGELHILESTPSETFDDSVRKAVPRWKFSPGELAGEPVTSWIVTNVRFTMD